MGLDAKNITKRRKSLKSFILATTPLCGAAALFCLALAPRAAYAMRLYSDNGVTVNLDTTLEYTGAIRVNDPSYTLLNDVPNYNDGDQNFKHGMVSNEFEILPVLSIKDGSYGVHISGQAYIDTMYLQKNQNSSPGTLNANPGDFDNQQFASGTRNENGRNAQLLDAFAYGSHSFSEDGSQAVTLKVGRQTLLWGQSLFFTNNGIAGGQAPIDINKALTLANPQAQQIFMPVGQVVLTYQPNAIITVQGYYQFEWRPSQFPGSGSYFSPIDIVGPGSARIIAGGTPFGPVYFSRGPDVAPNGNGQFGLGSQFQLGNYDLGLYALRFDAKTPQFYLYPAGPPVFSAQGGYLGQYSNVYPKDIQVYGASISSTLGPANVAGEISGRRNQPLYSNAVVPTPDNNENSNPAYAVGNIVNAQASAIYISPGLPLMPGGMTVLGEVEYNQVIEVTANKSALIAGRTPDGLGIQVQATPIYYDVFPQTNITFPIGITWYPTGRSQLDNTEQAGTGVLNVGVAATYKSNWSAGINYKDFLGSTAIVQPGTSKQAFADRGYVNFYLQRTF